MLQSHYFLRVEDFKMPKRRTATFFRTFISFAAICMAVAAVSGCISNPAHFKTVFRFPNADLRLILLPFLVVILALLVGCPGKPDGAKIQKPGDSGAKTGNSPGEQAQPSGVIPEGPIRIAFVPSVESGPIDESVKEFDIQLTGLLGHPVQSTIVLSYTAAIEQMQAGRFEGAFLPPLAYVLAHDRYDVRVVLTAIRKGSPTYRGEIITRADSGINAIQDLKGKTFGFVEASSASGHLYPKTLLITNGINPDKDLKEVTFVGSHDSVVMAVLQGRIQAGACFDDARTRLLQTEPDVLEKTKVIAFTPAIPADTFSLRADCVGPFYDKLVGSLEQLGKAGKESVLFKIYEIEGLVPAQDSDYNPIRDMVKTLGLDLESEVSKGK